MMMDGSLVYIDTLAANGDGRLPEDMDKSGCPIALEPAPNDGIGLTNKFRIMRLKQPMVDLICMDGMLNAIEGGLLNPKVAGNGFMDEGTIYEMDMFQEWKQMKNGLFSSIAVDPDSYATDLSKRWRVVLVRDYDFRSSFNTQVISISKGRQTILAARCKSEDFIRRVTPTRIMSQFGIPAVFSFSIPVPRPDYRDGQG
ncbi:MAG: hypothetical protein Q9207_004935 [Kuettlingeria erythrocarpa]